MSGFITGLPNLNLLTFRDLIRQISPRWLRRVDSAGVPGLAAKILYSIAIHFDATADAALEGVRKRFPLMATSVDALGRIGKGRKISRGPAEVDLSYATRLVPWLTQHRTRGGPYAMLQQIAAYWAATPFDVTLAYESGKRFTMPAGGPITESLGPPWDGTNPAAWARWWLVYAWPGTVTSDGVWSDPGTWDDGGTWDTSLTVADVQAIRQVPREWNAGHTQGHVTLLIGGAGVWDVPLDTWGSGGTWGATDTTLTITV